MVNKETVGFVWGRADDSFGANLSRYYFKLNQSMDSRTQRYMQRIEQIMNVPKRGIPSYRPSKSPISCKPNHLDKYLKYELSSKIIQKIISQNHHRLVHQFFNAVRVSEYRQKEKIYKFIAIQKAQPSREVYVDGTIVCKIMVTTLKELLRQRYIDFINCLQTYPNQVQTPQKPRITRMLSAKDSSPIHNRMRTLTNASKMEKASSVYLQSMRSPSHKSDKSEIQIKEYTLKIMSKVVMTKIEMLVFSAYHTIYKFGMQNQSSGEKCMPKEVTSKEAPVVEILPAVRFKKGWSIVIVERFFNKFMSYSFNRIKKYGNDTSERIKIAHILSEKLSKCIQKKKFQHSHHFFSIIRSIIHSNSEVKGQDFLFMSLKGKSAVSNQTPRSHITESSLVQPHSPLAKLNFYFFVDKIVKLIFVLSKMLLPLKEAFVRIDHYASWAYKLEQSLKAAPRSILMNAFQQIQQVSPRQRGQRREIDPEVADKINCFIDFMDPLCKTRLIQGFTHIKIISKERDLKIIILPARQNIVQQTKKFITDRDEYSAHSHSNWEELKSIILSSNSSEKLRKRSSVLP